MAGLMKEMLTFLKRTYVMTLVFSAPDPMAGHCQPIPLLVTPGHSQESLAQSLVGSLLLSSGAHKVLFLPSKSLFPYFHGSSVIKSPGIQSQIPWGFSVPFPDPQVGKPVAGPRTFTTVQELL